MVIILFCLVSFARAENPFVHRLFNNNMVLQRDAEAPVWGWTTPGSQVIVNINGQTKVATAAPSGRWQVEIGPFPAGGPYTLVITGPQTATFTNVMMGDVWFFSGQSNMEWTINELNHPNNSVEIADSANFSRIRSFNLTRSLAVTPQENLANGNWVAAGPTTTASFSGTAYYSSREIAKRLGNVPIGMLTSSWGGTRIHSWLSPATVAEEVDFTETLFDESLLISTNTHNTISSLHNAMVAPFAPFKIKGVVWYQGEYNVSQPEQYEHLLSKLRDDFRRNFNDPQLPFIIIQLPDNGALNNNIIETGWAELREAQRNAANADPYSRCVPTIELSGDGNLHPSNKQDIGQRVSVAAASVAYNETLVDRGPEMISAIPNGNSILCTFEHVGAGLMVGSKTALQPTQQVSSSTVAGFAVAGADRIFRDAVGTITGLSTVSVTSSQVETPLYVRYAWKNRPLCNLYNKIVSGSAVDGLPATSFRNDPVARLEVFGGTGSITTQPGSTVTASATIDPSQIFSNWSGDTAALTSSASPTTQANLSKRYTAVRANTMLVGPPSGLACISLDGKLELRWNTVPGCHYILYRSASNSGVFTQISPELVLTASYTDSSLVNGVTYYYKIRAITADGQGPLSEQITGVPEISTEAAAAVYINVPEAADYEVAFAADLPVNGVGSNPFTYTIDHQSNAPPQGFDRVAYYMELVDHSGKHWVYASMDAFTPQIGQLRIPHAGQNNVTFQTKVSNLSVRSNHPGIQTGSFDQGNIEMWHYNYNGNNSKDIFGAAATFDWGDEIRGTPSGHGSFQVHNPTAKQVLFAYNGWAKSDTSEVGIGNAPTDHPDWTLSKNSSSYSSRKLVVLVRPKRANIEFTSIPKNQQIIPRNLDTNTAVVAISGKEISGGFESIVLRSYQNGVIEGSDLVAPLQYVNGEASFSFSPTITAALISHDFEIYVKKSGRSYLVRRVGDIAAGDVYLWYGQSNAETIPYDTSESYASPWIRTYGMSSDSADRTIAYPFWSRAVGDGSRNVAGGVGQWPLVIGRKIVNDYGIPIAILNGGRNAYSILQLQRDDTNPDALADDGALRRPYNRLRHRAIQAGVAAHIRGIFYFQGESDNDNTSQHIEGFTNLMEDWAVDYPGVERVFVTQLDVGCGVTRESIDLRNAQRNFGSVFQNVITMSTNALVTHPDQCHYPFAGGYEVHGLNTYRQVARELYAASDDPNIDPPDPERVEISNASGDRVLIALKRPDATLTLQPGALADFRLTGSNAVLLSAKQTASGIELQYDRSVSGATSLAYLGHFSGEGDWIRNANGVGLLAFTEQVIDPTPQLHISVPYPLQFPTGSTQHFSATASSLVGRVVRMEAYLDGILHSAINNSALSFDWIVPAAGRHSLVLRASTDRGYHSEKTVVFISGTAPAPAGIISGLNVWLKPEQGIVADANGEISQWQDSSGNNHHASQATTNAKPKFVANAFGHLPGVYFDGGDFLTSATGMTSTAYTKIVLINVGQFGHQGNFLGGPNHAIYLNRTNVPRILQGSAVATSDTALTIGQHILMATYDSATTNVVLYLDGKLVASATGAAAISSPIYQLGASNSNHFLIGTIGEAIIYNRVLSTHELGEMNDYLVQKNQLPPAATKTSYDNWSLTHLPPGADKAATSQTAGVSNLLRYALGLDSEAGPPDLLKLDRVGNEMSVRYQRPTDRDGISYQLYESSDLNLWTPVSDQPGITTNGIENRIYSRSTLGRPKLFYRLQVKIP